MNIFSTLGHWVGGAVIALGVILGGHAAAPATPLAGSTFTPVQGTQFTVSSTVLPADTSITLSSFTTPDGRSLTMTYFGYKGYGTLDPTNSARLESISFTGITQNANGSATLTGVSRGLDFVSPYAASSTLGRIHLVGSNFILANTAAFYGGEFAFVNDPTTIAAPWTFGSTTQPAYDGNPATWASGLSFVDKAYVDSGILQGAATSTFSNMGISQLATNAQTIAGTASSTTGAPLVIANKQASSTYNGATAFNGEIPVLRTTKNIDPNFIATSSTDNYSFLGTVNIASSTIGTSTQATTTVTGSLTLNGIQVTAKFGGTGADGALNTSGGNVNINLASAPVVVKNYTSINIATNNLTFTNANINGDIIILKSQGNCTISSNIYATSTGALAGTLNGGTGNTGIGNIGPDRFGGGGVNAGNPAGAGGLSSLFATSTAGKIVPLVPGAGGGGGGQGTNAGSNGGKGGDGGGALYIECGGALNFTGAISVAGGDGTNGTTNTAGGGGGGGGGGGTVAIVYNTLTSKSGTVSVTAGTHGSGASGSGNTGGAGGGGGAGAGADGITGNNEGGSGGGDGGDGGVGVFYIVQNTEF